MPDILRFCLTGKAREDMPDPPSWAMLGLCLTRKHMPSKQAVAGLSPVSRSTRLVLIGTHRLDAE